MKLTILKCLDSNSLLRAKPSIKLPSPRKYLHLLIKII